MKLPTYRWICHQCAQGNPPGKVGCSHCGFPAIASAGEIAKAKGEPDPMIEAYRQLSRPLPWLVMTFLILLLEAWMHNGAS